MKNRNLLIGKVGKRPFRLPLETVTSTIAILAIRGSGKTYAAGVLAEEMLKAGLHIVILDPEDAWWGLRSSAKGNKAGYPIVVFGGEKADVPLKADSAKMVVNLIVEQGISAVVCTSDFNEKEARQFSTDFANHLYYKKRLTKYRTPLHVFIDEADSFCPQNARKNDGDMVNAFGRLVKRGRRRGIGVTMISQRPAVVNKNILTQVETLIVLRITSSNDRKAVSDWVESRGTEDEHGHFSRTVASLKTGEAWIWSPGFLGVFDIVQIREKETFDSSATPKLGKIIRAPKKLADIDLKSLRESMGAIIEKQKSEDPRELQKQVAELKRQLSKKPSSPAMRMPDKKVLHEAVTNAINNALGAMNLKWRTRMNDFKDSLLPSLKATIQKMADDVEGMAKADLPMMSAKYHRLASPQPGSVQVGESVKMGKMERSILTVLAQRFPESAEKRQVAVMTGYSHKSGSFNNARSKLCTAGYMEVSGEQWAATQEGIVALGDFEPLPVGQALMDHWGRTIGKMGRAILSTLVHSWPDRIPKSEVAYRLAYTESGSFNNAVSKLRTLELINGTKELQCSGIFFDDDGNLR